MRRSSISSKEEAVSEVLSNALDFSELQTLDGDPILGEFFVKYDFGYKAPYKPLITPSI